jgi:hypothetical protein
VRGPFDVLTLSYTRCAIKHTWCSVGFEQTPRSLFYSLTGSPPPQAPSRNIDARARGRCTQDAPQLLQCSVDQQGLGKHGGPALAHLVPADPLGVVQRGAAPLGCRGAPFVGLAQARVVVPPNDLHMMRQQSRTST